MSEPNHEDVAEPIDADAAESDASAGRHRTSDEQRVDDQQADEQPAGDQPADDHEQVAQPKVRGLSSTRWVARTALLVALIAVAGAAWALFLPSWLPKPSKLFSPATTSAPVSSPTAGQFTDQQVADAKGRACDAFNTVSQALAVQTHVDIGKDNVALFAVAANGRAAMVGGSQYLLERLDPATPAPLGAAVRKYADLLQDIAMHSMAGITGDDPGQAAEKNDIDALGPQIVDLCK
jgi:hypothetical protein